MSAPTLSLLTVVKNRVETLPEALASLDAQTRPPDEHVIQDGASGDGTLEVLLARARRDTSVSLESAPDDGLYAALNRALARAAGDVVGLLHSDDMLAHPRVLEAVMAAFADRSVDAVYGDLHMLGPADAGGARRVCRRWRAGRFREADLKRGWMPPHPALFLRRAIIEERGGYDESYRIAGDYEAVLRWFGPGLETVYLPQVLVLMGTGGASTGRFRARLAKTGEDWRAIRTHRMGGAAMLACKSLRKIPQFF
jgi:glycosyltransferase